MLATASFDGTTLVYDAALFEHNDIVLSPGEFFSIQDAADVLQRGEGGSRQIFPVPRDVHSSFSGNGEFSG
jgi:hypothetical protein